jgi:flagellar basal-body rod modification protein FlgD
MSIAASSVSNFSSTNTVASATTTKGVVDPNMFLKLLVSTIQNQDPTNPADPTEMLQQLASMSQVQQSAQTNLKLASLLETVSVGQAAALIGRQITDKSGVDLGRISSVKLAGESMVARMLDGREAILGPGLTIRS